MKFLFMLFLMLILTGCQDNTTKIDDTQKKIKNFYCPEILDIIDINNSVFLSKNNLVYEYSKTKLYDNNKSCKKINADIKAIRLINNIILDNDNNIYYYSNGEIRKIKNEQWKSKYFGSVFRYFNKENYKNIYAYKPFGEGEFSGYINKNGNIYPLKSEKWADGRWGYNVGKEKILNLAANENIIYMVDNTIVTDKNFYIYNNEKIINEEECKGYIPCVYGPGFDVVKDEIIKNNMNNIIFFKKDVFGDEYIVMKSGDLIINEEK